VVGVIRAIRAIVSPSKKGIKSMQSQIYSNLDTTDQMSLAETTRILKEQGQELKDFQREVNADADGHYSVGLIECWLGY
jgi:hypothetical protein